MNRRSALGTLIALGAAGCGRVVPARNLEGGASGTFFTATAPYVPTRPEVMNAMLALAEIEPRDVVYDLGCGDGRLVIAACKRFGARGLGVDLENDLIARAQAEAQWQGVADRAEFITADLFDLDLKPATVVMLYLSVEINLRLRPRMLAQLAPGARIVSNRFDMGGVWIPERTIHAGDTPVHLWRIARRTG